MYVKPKKHLGQHFLKDLSIAQDIAESLKDVKCPDALEIGPGTGVLTQFLIKREDIKLTAVEVDRESIAYLNENYPELTPRLIEGDFLRMNLAEMFPNGVNIIGNFPYNISSQIYFKILEYKDYVPQSVGMIQKEVAERISEKPGKKGYGILSVFLQAFYDIEYLFTVNPDVFNPPPKVRSAVIRITRNNRKSLDCDAKLFKKVVKGTFLHKRKMMRNSVRTAFPTFVGDHEFFTRRPETLSVDEFIELTNFIEKNTPAVAPKEEKETTTK
ncbi:MAG: 16S rRNA (adenine(1518)-N(6)/adenine(1519)-N(6))-dimethyltransferase RsmA [Bacteroidetes bacterium]|nr:16S rRNA (adenine(1518)-N(6)/adenine(1519)-N(6))-dimethyltransferase RsmA [Bacteroidota bacterium]